MLAKKKVAVVLDRSFGEKLAELAHSQPVWIWDSSANRAAAKRLWDAGVLSDQVTVFAAAGASSAESAFLDILRTVDQHYPGWSQLTAIGVEFIAAIRSALAEYGEGNNRSIPGGFIFERSIS
ncbi:hypothetical protein [Pleomorphomonas oryzae]|uniref:hypothetical protein n=1 Tax=Pleomorphomonas oryzae TaxID=261934 RepID=UPI00047BD5D1|nr:hypothetical protein [Pleomorphomonas oryzae]